MDGLPTNLPKNPDALIALLQKQQREIDSLQHTLTCKDKTLAHRDKTLVKKDDTIRQLEERLRALLSQRFGKSSEKLNPDQFQLFNEAELLGELNPETDSDSTQVKGHRRQKHKSSHALPAHLPRVDVVHDLDEHIKQCDCGNTLEEIDEEILEQLSVVPKQYYVIRHRRKKYACSCKQCICTVSMPIQPLPRSQASPQVIADAMVSKYRDGIPLYRQEKIAAWVDVALPRGKLARWIIDGSEVFQVILNLLMDTFFSYDIAQSDDTAYSGDGDRQFRVNVTDRFNLLHWKLKRNVSGHDQSTFAVFSSGWFCVFFRMESPISSRRCAPFKRRSRMASATVASPM